MDDQGGGLGATFLKPARVGSRAAELGQHDATQGTGTTFFFEWAE